MVKPRRVEDDGVNGPRMVPGPQSRLESAGGVADKEDLRGAECLADIGECPADLLLAHVDVPDVIAGCHRTERTSSAAELQTNERDSHFSPRLCLLDMEKRVNEAR